MKNDIILLVLVSVDSPEDNSSSVGIKSRAANRAYTDGWERIFGKKESEKQDSKLWN